jgi:hypothetical protein
MKNVAKWLLIAIVVVWVMNDPTGAAALVHWAIGAIQSMARSLSTLASGISSH